jgi:hypothetical protein
LYNETRVLKKKRKANTGKPVSGHRNESFTAVIKSFLIFVHSLDELTHNSSPNLYNLTRRFEI